MGDYPPETFTGWEHYPANLDVSSIYTDVKRYNTRLSQDAERLLASNKESRVEVAIYDPGARKAWRKMSVTHEQFEDAEKFATCMTRINSLAANRVIYIVSDFSWSQLLISEEILRKLFTYMCVHPHFLDIIHLFGEKLGPVEESLSIYFDNMISPKPSTSLGPTVQEFGYELGYNMKYVEQHGRPFPKDPWSIRETGVCQKFNPSSMQSDWIFIQPSEKLKERLATIYPHLSGAAAGSQFQIHVAILSTVSENWRFYINYLEEYFLNL
ncbi:MAG: hypothetical protein M1839_006316, partial [Geoglossum umbratile]